MPDHIFIPGVGNSKETVNDEFLAFLKRSDAYFHVDRKTMALHIKSRNREAPLTNKEKARLATRLALEMCPYSVVFDDFEERGISMVI